ncbi:MAG: phosphoglycerate kinase [Bacilli bacterium]|nr:phosphoglycerate kinase [Bacilli bacterium]
MKYLSEVEVKNKNVILRCDFNVPVKDGKITDDSKILKSLKTIKYLLENNNRVLILSHFGRVKTEEDKKKNSLKIVYEYLKKYIDVVFVENNENVEFYLNTSKSNCFLLENTRYTDLPEKRESKNNLELSKYWASFGDIFILDAFGSLHRAHTSTAGIGAYLPTYLGFLVEEELKNLEVLIKPKNESFIVIMGGAKVDDKILIIKSMLEKCDKLVLTGGILNTFLKVMGYNIGNSLVSEEEVVLNDVKDILDNYIDKLVYSNEFVVLNKNKVLNKSINEIVDDDIIFDNIVDINFLDKDSIVFFNGTCGKYEDDNYSKGTKSLLRDLVNSKSKVFAGGGDTVSAITKFGYDKSFKYLSSGGGATLEYVAYGNLKAIEFIKENGVEN